MLGPRLTNMAPMDREAKGGKGASERPRNGNGNGNGHGDPQAARDAARRAADAIAGKVGRRRAGARRPCAASSAPCAALGTAPGAPVALGREGGRGPHPGRRPRRARPGLHPRVAAAACGCWRRSTSAAEVRGLGNIPEDGPVLLVGNHSGGNLTPDTGVFTLAFSTYFGVERAFYQLAHNLVLSMPGPRLPAQVRHGRRVAGERPQGAARRRGGARLPRRRLRGPPPDLGAPPRRLRRPQGLHPARAAGERPDRPGRRRRRPGDLDLPLARRGARARAEPRPAVPPEGPADLAGAAVGPQRRRHARPRPAAGQDHGRGAAADRPARGVRRPTRTSTRSTTTSCA